MNRTQEYSCADKACVQIECRSPPNYHDGKSDKQERSDMAEEANKYFMKLSRSNVNDNNESEMRPCQAQCDLCCTSGWVQWFFKLKYLIFCTVVHWALHAIKGLCSLKSQRCLHELLLKVEWVILVKESWVPFPGCQIPTRCSGVSI